MMGNYGKMFAQFIVIVAVIGAVVGAAVSAVACATLKPHAKTANDIARDLCNATLSAEDVPVGLTVEDACNLHRFVDPFLRAILGAQQTAAAQIAASSGGDSGQ